MSSAALGLKKLRTRAVPSLTVRALAERLGMPLSSYARYEDPTDFKKKHLPLEFARRVATILADHGIDPRDAMELAGAGDPAHFPPPLSVDEQRLINCMRQLGTKQRGAVMVLVESMLASQGGAPRDVRDEQDRRGAGGDEEDGQRQAT